MDEHGIRRMDPTVGSEGRESEFYSSIFKTKVEGNSHIRENEGRAGNKKSVSKFEDNPRRKTYK
jgi:hypothetical protein